MHSIVWLLVILLGIGWLAAAVPLAGTPANETPALGWRRTADGWERPTRWMPNVEVHRPALHPLVVALLELLLALSVLIAFPDKAWVDK